MAVWPIETLIPWEDGADRDYPTVVRLVLRTGSRRPRRYSARAVSAPPVQCVGPLHTSPRYSARTLGALGPLCMYARMHA